jgi:alpha-L-glutamate ligase-like protein
VEFLTPRRFRQLGVLGMNRRNFAYVLGCNSRRSYPLVDDKIRTKELAGEAGITVPEVYEIVSFHYQLRDIEELIGDREDFAIKPARGAGGDGIQVIAGRLGGGAYRTAGGRLKSVDDLRHHLAKILSGMYSLSGTPDHAFLEYRVKPDPVLGDISFQGVPDVRVLVYRGYPAMAMVRLPTAMAGGKANLHQGAVGAGIDLGRGTTSHGVWKHCDIDVHPDTGRAIEGIEIPGWGELLQIAASCYDLTGLGYLGVDLVLDESHGPMMLELNARPGLDIQIANRRGLRGPLARIDELDDGSRSAAERVETVRRHLGDGTP